MPRGGARPGAGRKPKSALERAIDGNAGKRGTVLQHPSVPTAIAPVDEFDAPDSLTTDERLVWLRQAPFAFANRTLHKATAMAFERYCKLVVREQAEAKSSACDGTVHARQLKTLNTLELQFQLTANGKPAYQAAAETKELSPLERLLQRKRL